MLRLIFNVLDDVFVSQIAKMFYYISQKKKRTVHGLGCGIQNKERFLKIAARLYGCRVFFPAVVSNVIVFSCILFILLLQESDQCAVRARFG